MTVTAYLMRHQRRTWAAILLFLVAVGVDDWFFRWRPVNQRPTANQWLAWAPFGVMLVIALVMLGLVFTNRCPFCKKLLSRGTFTKGEQPWSKCPYCKTDFNQPVPQK
jgi:hypothetical protein